MTTKAKPKTVKKKPDRRLRIWNPRISPEREALYKLQDEAQAAAYTFLKGVIEGTVDPFPDDVRFEAARILLKGGCC